MKVIKSITALIALLMFVNTPIVSAQEDDQYALLESVITEEYVNNETLLVAKEEFDLLMDSADLTDLSTGELTGSTPDEVLDQFESSVEPEIETDEQGNTIYRYYYEIEDINLVTNEPMVAEMILFFHQDHLEYAGVTTPDFMISNTDGPEMAQVTEWSENLSPISELTDVMDDSDKDPILGFAVMNYNDTIYPQIMLTGHQEGEENPVMLMMALQDGEILAVGSTIAASIYVDPQTQMMSFYGQLVSQFDQGI